MAWYSHLFQNFPEFVVVFTIKGFDIVNKTEIHVFLEVSCFFDDAIDVGNLISGSSAFSKSSLNKKLDNYDGVEGHVLIFYRENSKITTRC